MDSLTAKWLSGVGLALALVLAAAAALPAEYNAETMDLSAVLNRTTCPIVVDIDEDAKRIPRFIKIFKCGTDPLEHCRAKNVPDYECCHRRRDDVRMACVEVQDLVLVFYPGEARGRRHQSLTVSVGCACVMEPVTRLEEPEPS